jgi:hypothetical protein
MIAILSLGIRAYINFSQNLLIGNGGYYPLQVRTILERNELAFSDMPFLFYLDAGIVRLISFLGIAISDQLILNVVKIVDSLSITFLLIPLYQIVKLTKNTRFSYHIIIMSFATVLSFYTLNLTSTSQKNALAITFLFFAILWLMKYLLVSRDKKFLLLTFLFLLLTGFTHFGTFVFAIIAGTLFILFRYKTKALIPLIVLLASSLSIIYFFDSVRFERLTSIWKELFQGQISPPQLAQVIIYGAMAFLAIKGLKKFNHHFTSSEKVIISTSISLLIIIPLPIIDHQFTHRLTTFLFIPQVLLLLFFSPYISNRAKKICSSILAFVSLLSILFILFVPPHHSLSKNALKDLKELIPSIPAPDNTVIISKHNLEFWVAWTLKVDVSQESKFDSTLVSDYDHVYILNQTKGIDTKKRPPHDKKHKNHFDEPSVPQGSVLIGSTEYFELYEYGE